MFVGCSISILLYKIREWKFHAIGMNNDGTLWLRTLKKLNMDTEKNYINQYMQVPWMLIVIWGRCWYGSYDFKLFKITDFINNARSTSKYKFICPGFSTLWCGSESWTMKQEIKLELWLMKFKLWDKWQNTLQWTIKKWRHT